MALHLLRSSPPPPLLYASPYGRLPSTSRMHLAKTLLSTLTRQRSPSCGIKSYGIGYTSLFLCARPQATSKCRLWRTFCSGDLQRAPKEAEAVVTENFNGCGRCSLASPPPPESIWDTLWYACARGFRQQFKLAVVARPFYWLFCEVLPPEERFHTYAVPAWVILGFWKIASPAVRTLKRTWPPEQFLAAAASLMVAFFAVDKLAVLIAWLLLVIPVLPFMLWSFSEILNAGGDPPPADQRWNVPSVLICLFFLCLPHHMVRVVVDLWKEVQNSTKFERKFQSFITQLTYFLTILKWFILHGLGK